MSHKIFVNKYILEAVPEDLLWYKRDSLITYTDQLKYKRFISDPDSYLEKAEVFNFDMIHALCNPKEHFCRKKINSFPFFRE